MLLFDGTDKLVNGMWLFCEIARMIVNVNLWPTMSLYRVGDPATTVVIISVVTMTMLSVLTLKGVTSELTFGDSDMNVSVNVTR